MLTARARSDAIRRFARVHSAKPQAAYPQPHICSAEDLAAIQRLTRSGPLGHLQP